LINQKNVQDDLGLDFLGQDTLICDYNTLTLDGKAYSKHWWTSDNGFSSESRRVDLNEPGTYYLKLSDQDECFAYDTLQLSVSYLKIENLTIKDVTCNDFADGRAEIEVGPENWRYTVRWPDGQTGLLWDELSGGSYTVDVEDTFGCKARHEFSVFEPDTLDLDLEKLVHPICSDVPNGSITLNAIGGNGDYAYSWSQGSTASGISDLSEGAYSVGIKDKNLCVITRNYVLSNQKNVQADLGLDFLGQDTLICDYNTLPLDGKAYSKHWWTSDNGFTSRKRYVDLDEPGTYYLKLADEDQCFAYDTLQLAVSYLKIDDLILSDVTCHSFANGRAQIHVSPNDWKHWVIWPDKSSKDSWENLSGGQYQVKVIDDYSCVASKDFSIYEPEELTLNVENLFHPSCFGVPDGFIRVKAQGGNEDYKYEWTHGSDKYRLTKLDEGDYSVLVSDAKGCELTKNFALRYQKAIYPDLGEDQTLCTNNFTSLYPGDYSTYRWMSGNKILDETEAELIVVEANEYSVEVKDEEGCTASDQIQVVEKESILNPILLASSSIALGDTLMVLDVSQPKPENLQWAFTGEHEITELTDFYCKVVFSEEGLFEMKLTAQLDGCLGQLQQPILVVPARTVDEDTNTNSSDSYVHLSKLSVFPNPTDGPFEAEVELAEVADVTFYLVNILNGKIIDKRVRKGLKAYRETYNLTQSGVYCIFAESQGERKVFKLVVI